MNREARESGAGRKTEEDGYTEPMRKYVFMREKQNSRSNI